MIFYHLRDTLFSLRAEPLAVVACAWEQATIPLSAWLELVFLLRGHKGEQEIWRASGVLKRALGWNLEVRPACKRVLLGVSVQVSRSPFSRSKIKGLFRNAGKTLPASKCVWFYGYGFIISFYRCKGNTCVYAAGERAHILSPPHHNPLSVKQQINPFKALQWKVVTQGCLIIPSL